MKLGKKNRILVGLAVFLFAGMANAIPVTWTLNNVLFDDGGTAYGSFTYDADINLYSNIDVTTTAGSTASGGHYDVCHFFYCVASGSETLAVFGLSTDDYAWFGITLAGPLSNSGGNVQIQTGPCQTSCEYPGRDVISGSVSAVPVPAAVWLFGSALAGLGWMRHKREL